MRRYEPLERPAAPAADAERPGPSHLPNRVSREVVARVSTKAQAALWVAGMVMLFVHGGVGDKGATTSGPRGLGAGRGPGRTGSGGGAAGRRGGS